MLNRSLVSSNSNEWATPQKLFDMLDSEFHFTLDPCSSHMNCKTDKHYTINENGLQQDWSGEHVFMNPPYGYQTSQWIEKAYKESLRGAVVVCLIVARTDTSYWHDIIFKYAAQLTFPGEPEEREAMKRTIELPVEIGTVVYEADFPRYPQYVIGYRIGRLMGEDEEEFEEERKADELYIDYEGFGMSGSSPVSRFGKSLFLTSEEAEKASSEN